MHFTMLYSNYCYIFKENFPQKFSPCKVPSIISKGLIELNYFLNILNLNAARPYPCEDKSVFLVFSLLLTRRYLFSYSLVVFVDGAGAGREQCSSKPDAASFPFGCVVTTKEWRARFVIFSSGWASDLTTYLPSASPGELTTVTTNADDVTTEWVTESNLEVVRIFHFLGT